MAVYPGKDGKPRGCFQGVETCAEGNACPLCAHRIRSVRALELSQQCEAYAVRHGLDAIGLLTLTIRHHRGHDLRAMRRGLTATLNDFTSRLQRKRAKLGGCSRFELWGFVGSVRALEVTHGRNGWHPHVHALWFFEGEQSGERRACIRAQLSQLWRECVASKMGPEFVPNDEHGVDLRGGADAGRYLQKLAFELADPLSKAGREVDGTKGRSPFELLWEAGKGDDDAGRLFVQFREAMKGARVFEYSRKDGFKQKLRELAGQGVEATDEEIVEEGKGARVAIELDSETWNRVCRRPGARSAVLNLVEAGSGEAVADWLRREGLWGERPSWEAMWGWFDDPGGRA